MERFPCLAWHSIWWVVEEKDFLVPVVCFWHENSPGYKIPHEHLWPVNLWTFFWILVSIVYEIYVTGDRISFLHSIVLGTSLKCWISSAYLLCKCVLADPIHPSYISGFLGRGISERKPTIELLGWKKLKLNTLLFCCFICKRNENRGVWVWAPSACVFMHI